MISKQKEMLSQNSWAPATYLKITPTAEEQVAKLLTQKPEAAGIRIVIRTRGCSGLSYKLEYADLEKNISKYDELLELKSGAKIFIDPKASMFLIGATMDYFERELESGFDFVNPNEKGRCGCGESFHVQ